MKNSILSRLSIVAFVLTFVAVSFAQQRSQQLTTPPKVLVFYSSIGMGHISAARAIEQSIKARDPKAVVVLKDIRDFEAEPMKTVGERIFWFLVKNFPNKFDAMFRKAMQRGNDVEKLSDIKSGYNETNVLKFVTSQNPTSIIATHYGSAQVLGNLREKGYFKDKPIGWLHTDYFKGYFPRISQRIESTFVGMQVLRDQWVEEGIRPERVTTTGMPVNLSLFEPVDRVKFLESKGLDPKIRTIVLASGGEGVGNFPLIVEQVSKQVDGPLQIIAVCAKNEKHVQNLNKLKPSLRSGVRLDIHGMVPNADLLSYIKSSDLFITKSGGLSPTEGFAINKPMVLLDVYGGHERDNADLFEKEGLAVVNRDQRNIGHDVRKVLDDHGLQERMLRAQLAFRNSFNLDAITDFAFDSRKYLDVESFQIGLEASRPVQNTAETLAELERHSPSDIEILLSYPKSYNGKYLGPENNPFGHLAVRVGDKVYTANGRAQSGVEQMLIVESSLQEYLYGTERPFQNVEMTDAFGSAYGRDNISLRVKGISPQALALMHAEVAKIQEHWRAGETKWTAREHNCADFVLQILQAGGVKTPESLNWRNAKHITMPLDVFETYRSHFSGRGDVRSELVMYEHVPNSANIYKTARFPLSIHQLKRSVKNMFFRNVDPVEILSGKRVKIIDGPAKAAALVNVNGESAVRDHTLRPVEAVELERMRSEITALETQVEEMSRRLKSPGACCTSLKTAITTHLQKLSAADRELVLAGRVAEIRDPAARAEATELMRKVNAWNAEQQAYQQKLDQMSLLELRLLLKSTWSAMTSLRAELGAAHDRSKLVELDKNMAAARTHYNKYLENESQIGKPKDGPLRTDPARQFFTEAKRFFDGADSTILAPVTRSFWEKLKVTSAQLYRRVRLVLKLSPTALRMMVTLWTNPNATPNKAAFLDQIRQVFKTIGTEANIKVEVKGAERLPRDMTMRNKVVHVIAPTHRDPILDGIVMANLPLRNYLLVMAPSQFVPASMVDRVSNVDSVIPVGGGSDIPVSKVIEQLAKGTSNTILIYPEGSVSAGLGETRPVREKFNWGLIERLKAEGYDVRLTPVVYKDNGQFLHRGSVAGFLDALKEGMAPKTLSVEIGETVPRETLDLLLKTQNNLGVGHFLRASWLEGLATDKTFLDGVMRIGPATERARTEFGQRSEVRTEAPVREQGARGTRTVVGDNGSSNRIRGAMTCPMLF